MSANSMKNPNQTQIVVEGPSVANSSTTAKTGTANPLTEPSATTGTANSATTATTATTGIATTGTANSSTTATIATTGTANSSTTGSTGTTASNSSGDQRKEKITIEELNTQINEHITKLKDKLNGLDFNDMKNEMTIKEVCETISDKNLLGEFDKGLYSSLNKYFQQGGFENVMLRNGSIKLIHNGNLSQLIYAMLVNGLVDDDKWPSEKLKKIFIDSLKESTFFGGHKKIIKRKRKYLKKKI